MSVFTSKQMVSHKVALVLVGLVGCVFKPSGCEQVADALMLTQKRMYADMFHMDAEIKKYLRALEERRALSKEDSVLDGENTVFPSVDQPLSIPVDQPVTSSHLDRPQPSNPSSESEDEAQTPEASVMYFYQIDMKDENLKYCASLNAAKDLKDIIEEALKEYIAKFDSSLEGALDRTTWIGIVTIDGIYYNFDIEEAKKVIRIKRDNPEIGSIQELEVMTTSFLDSVRNSTQAKVISWIFQIRNEKRQLRGKKRDFFRDLIEKVLNDYIQKHDSAVDEALERTISIGISTTHSKRSPWETYFFDLEKAKQAIQRINSDVDSNSEIDSILNDMFTYFQGEE